MPFVNEPLVSVIIAARNEESEIEGTLRGVLEQVYTNLEVVIVNDRSTDKTKEIIDRVVAEYQAGGHAGLPKKMIVVKNIDSLPRGWLGKNHACHVGSTLANPRSKYLLFLDADSRLEKTVMGRVARHACINQIEIMSVLPSYAPAPPLAWKSICTNFNHLLMMVVSFSTLVDVLKLARAWRCEDTSNKLTVTTGKFNLLGKKAYDAAGGYEAIKLEVVDDVYLAMHTKAHHIQRSIPIKATFVWGVDLVQVDWYRSLAQLCRGTQKHLFAGIGYNVVNAFALTVVGGIYYLLPQVLFVMSVSALWFVDATWFGMSHTQVCWVFALSSMYLLVNVAFLKWMSIQAFKLKVDDIGTHVFALMASLFAQLYGLFALWYSTITVLRDGGVQWAGTLYPLKQLIDARREMRSRTRDNVSRRTC